MNSQNEIYNHTHTDISIDKTISKIICLDPPTPYNTDTSFEETKQKN